MTREKGIRRKSVKKFNNLGEFKEWIKRNSGRILMSILRYALLICIGFIILLPLLEMLSTAVKSPAELGSPVSKWVPAQFSKENITVAFTLLDYPKTLAITFATTFGQVLLQTLSAALCGYAFARLNSKLTNILFFGVILTIVVPPSIFMLPQYIFFRNFDIFGIIQLITGKSINLLGSPIVIYILDVLGMGLKSGLYIYIFRQFFRGLPKELEEAAYVDGCGFVKTLVKVVMPNATSGIVTVATLSFVWNWNDTYFSNLFAQATPNLMGKLTAASSSTDEILQTLAKKIPATFDFNYESPIYQSAILSTGSLLIVIPLLILYLFLQKKFVESASRSGIVG